MVRIFYNDLDPHLKVTGVDWTATAELPPYPYIDVDELVFPLPIIPQEYWEAVPSDNKVIGNEGKYFADQTAYNDYIQSIVDASEDTTDVNARYALTQITRNLKRLNLLKDED
jgi:hypothetical protein